MTKRTRKTAAAPVAAAPVAAAPVAAAPVAAAPVAAAPVAASEVIVQGNEPMNEQNTVQQSDELQAMIDAEGNVPDETSDDSVAEPETTESESQGGNPAEVAPETAPEPEVAAAPVDSFADLPMTKVEDYEFRDLTDAVGNDPFKYDAVHKAAIEAKLPVKSGWKHSAAMVVKGQNRKEFKPGSVYGTIDQIVMQYGRAGVPAYVLVAKVRQLQIGNKRSKYCTALPPIGWAEGWVDTYISKNHGKVMEKKAPPITKELVEEVKAADIKAEKEGDRIAA